MHRIASAAGLLLFAFHVGAAQVEPRTPCESGTTVPSPADGTEPALETWVNLRWQPPACLGWPAADYKLVIAIAGRVTVADEAAVRARIGAISAMRGLRYWSVSENASRVLFKDASALTGPGGTRRADFSAAEISTGAVLHFVEEDNRSSKAVEYRMRILKAERDQVIVETENVDSIESFMVTLFPPGSLRAAYIMTRVEANAWRLYAISASTDAANNLVKIAKASYANRAKALYGHFAGGANP